MFSKEEYLKEKTREYNTQVIDEFEKYSKDFYKKLKNLQRGGAA